MPELNLYAEATGTINCAINSYITLTHGIGETPDDNGIACEDDGRADPAVFNLIRKNATEIVWQVSGTRETVNFRCWARRNHSIIDTRPTPATVTVTGGGASPRQIGSHVQILHDFGTRPVTVSA